MTAVVAGGGAAGFFAAIACAKESPDRKVILLEKTRQLLSKVRISGGGRCNVTHSCFDPNVLITHYPRGGRELRGPFSRFQPLDTIEWFQKRGVALKTEGDGRMFPITDSSDTIIQCLLDSAIDSGVEILTERGIEQVEKAHGSFQLALSNGSRLECDQLLLATGSSSKGTFLAQSLGHRIVPPVPSLFTFNIPNSPLLDLAGISVPKAEVYLPEFGLRQSGPLLLTHWGLSGPAVLKLSAWAARELHTSSYQTKVSVNWVPLLNPNAVRKELSAYKGLYASRLIHSDSPFALPKQLWKRILTIADIPEGLKWAQASRKCLEEISVHLQGTSFTLSGKTTYKQEFVTCGGVALEEVNFKTMESRLCPGLFFAGEILNIDGVTGGFNFQNAWTTGWIAGHSMKRA